MEALRKYLFVSAIFGLSIIPTTLVAEVDTPTVDPRPAKPATEEWWGPAHQAYVQELRAAVENNWQSERVQQDIAKWFRYFLDGARHNFRHSSSNKEPTTTAELYTLFGNACNWLVPELPNARPGFNLDAFGEGTADYLLLMMEDETIASFPSLSAGWSKRAKSRRTSAAAEQERVETIRAAAEAWKEVRVELLSVCPDWYAAMYRPWLEDIEAKQKQREASEAAVLAKAESDRKSKEAAAAQAAAEANAKRQARHALAQQFDAELARATTESAIAAEDQVFWNTRNLSPIVERRLQREGRAVPNSFQSVDSLFNELNLALESALNKINQGSEFVVPERGEFETTNAYNERVASMRSDHRIEIDASREQELTQWSSTRETIFYDFLGDPILEDLKYDADKEQFSLRLKSTTSPYRVHATLDVPLSQAPSVKSDLQTVATGRVNVVFQLTGGVLKPKVLLLRTDRDIWNAQIRSSSEVPIRFGAISAQAWTEAKEKRAADDAQKRHAAAERYAARQREEGKARRERYGHNGPFLQQGAIVCDEAKSIIRAAAISRADNPYVSIPSDCLIAQNEFTPISQVQPMAGGTVRAVLAENGYHIYSLERFVVR